MICDREKETATRGVLMKNKRRKISSPKTLPVDARSWRETDWINHLTNWKEWEGGVLRWRHHIAPKKKCVQTFKKIVVKGRPTMRRTTHLMIPHIYSSRIYIICNINTKMRWDDTKLKTFSLFFFYFRY